MRCFIAFFGKGIELMVDVMKHSIRDDSQQLRGCYNVLQALVTKLEVVSQEIEDVSEAFGDLLVRMDQDGVLHDQVHETQESPPLLRMDAAGVLHDDSDEKVDSGVAEQQQSTDRTKVKKIILKKP